MDCVGKRVGTTTDLWTSSAKRGYMVITLHYIDDEWEMRSVIIGFKRVMYPHTGEGLAELLWKQLRCPRAYYRFFGQLLQIMMY
jgi:hypothetical protein